MLGVVSVAETSFGNSGGYASLPTVINITWTGSNIFSTSKDYVRWPIFIPCFHDLTLLVGNGQRSGARFTKYLRTILRLSYDNAKVTIDLRRTSSLQNMLRRTQGFS